MKRKTTILLSSVMAGVLLVGGAFAAYSVTDNADPFGFVATPGTNAEEQTTYVTMSFGDNSVLSNIENLQVGEHRRAGIVSLKANVRYEGDFTVKLIDRTVRESTDTNKKLIDYLDIGIYEGANTTVAEGELPDATFKVGSVGMGVNEKTFPLVGVQAGKEYAVYLTLDDSVELYYSQMSEDKVYVEVDWSPKSGDLAVNYNVYFNKPTGWDEAWVYAWGNGKENAKFPGVKMTQLRGNIYTIAVPNNLTNLVFNAGDNVDDHKTADLEMTVALKEANKFYYDGTQWTELEEEQTLASEYNVKFGTADPVALAENTTTDKTDGRIAEYFVEGVSITAAEQFVLYAGNGIPEAQYVAYEGNLDDSGKVKVTNDSADVYVKIYEGTGENTGKLYYVVWVSDAGSTPVEDQVLFTNNQAWGNIHLYAFNDEEHKNADWPGVELTVTKTNDYGEEQYAVDWGDYDYIIINGSGGQTVDIDVTTLANKAGFYLTGEVDAQGHYLVGTY